MEHRDVRELSEDVDGMYEMSCPGHQKKTKRVLGNKKHMRLKILIGRFGNGQEYIGFMT